jgi:hypothetical protein
MQDIPRNELLDKLAAGWKVRTKAYGKSSLNNLEELQGIDLKCLIEDDWEGEPPGPSILHKHCSIDFAFRELKRGARFIRRPSWSEKGKCIFDKNHPQAGHVYELRLEDILICDWEVWT